VTTFATRDELLDCVYAATLIPFVTAARPCAALRGKWYCDAMVMPTLTSDVPIVTLVARDASVIRRLVPAARLEVDVVGGAEELMRMLV
jgi:hypothetical protein